MTQSRATCIDGDTYSDYWPYGYELGFGELIRPDVAGYPETHLWLALIVRSLLDKRLMTTLDYVPRNCGDRLTVLKSDLLREWMFHDEPTPTNLVWVAHHISECPEKLVHTVRQAWHEDWIMYGASVHRAAGDSRGQYRGRKEQSNSRSFAMRRER